MTNDEEFSGLCRLPFQSVMTFNSGTVKMCCVSEAIGNLQNNSLPEIWNSEKWQKVRRDFMRGEKPQECAECWKAEARGAISSRESILANDPILSQCKPSGEMDTSPQRLSIRLGTECNLKCIMCGPGNSSKWQEDRELADQFGLHPEFTSKISSPSMLEDEWLHSALQTATWIQFIGGEPLIIKRHRLILEDLVRSGRASQVTLMYSTNLQQLPDWCVDLWRNFKRIDLRASIDGTADTYEYIRYPGIWHIVRSNFEQLNELRDVRLNIAILPVYMSVNAMNLKEIFRWRNSLGWPTLPAIRPEYLEQPEFLAAHHLLDDAKDRAIDDLHLILDHEVRSEEESVFVHDLHRRIQNPSSFQRQLQMQKYLAELDRRRSTRFQDVPQIQEALAW